MLLKCRRRRSNKSNFGQIWCLCLFYVLIWWHFQVSDCIYSRPHIVICSTNTEQSDNTTGNYRNRSLAHAESIKKRECYSEMTAIIIIFLVSTCRWQASCALWLLPKSVSNALCRFVFLLISLSLHFKQTFLNDISNTP